MPTRIALLTLLLVASCTSLVQAAEAKRPNILFLFSDDQRFDTIGALGNRQIKTPHLDDLVRRGTTFTHTFVQGSTVGAVCQPSRAMLMSGRSLFRTPLQLDGVPLLPAVLRQAGYDTYGVGKWHNGQASYARAFDEGAAVFFGGMNNHRAIPVFPHDGSGKFPKQKASITGQFSTEIFADEAIRYVKQPHSDPFFLYVAFTAPHDPRTPPKEFADLYDPATIELPANFLPQHPFDNGEMIIRDEKLAPWPRTSEVVRQHIADYYGMISHLDAQIGRILATLEATGQADNTIVVFAADNGLAVGQHGLLGKQNLYDHSVRVPLIIAGPEIAAGERTNAFTYLYDLCPTLCEIAAADPPAGVDGRSLLPLAKQPSTLPPDWRGEVFNAYAKVQRSIRDERYKLIRYPQINYTQLFDLQSDPQEMNNLAERPEQAERVTQYLARLAAAQKEFGDTLPLTSDSPKAKEIDLSNTKP